MLCRDEVDRLTEILHSKGAGLSSGELTNKNQSMTPSRVAEGPLLAHKGPSTGPSRGALSSGELTNKVQSMTPSIVAQGAVPTHKVKVIPIIENQEGYNTAKCKSINKLQSTVSRISYHYYMFFAAIRQMELNMLLNGALCTNNNINFHSVCFISLDYS